MELPADLLDRPAGEAVRRIALALLARAESAAVRLADPEALDPEALHDFRVAVRRLRSCLRAYREPLAESVSKKPLARLRALATATNPGRDAEVQLAWLARERPALRPHERAGYDWLAARIEKRQQEAYAIVREELLDGFASLADRLRDRLAHYRVEIELDTEDARPQTFRSVLAPALAQHAAALAEDLARVDSLADEKEAHAARLEAKRLRYLLEPLTPALLPTARPALQELRALQDLLGELNDAHLLAEAIGQATAEAAADQARHLHDLALAGATRELATARRRTARTGLLTLATRLATHRTALFARLDAGWLRGRKSQQLVAEVERLTATLVPGIPDATRDGLKPA